MKANKRLSVAIVGCGYVANEHAIAWRRVKGVELAACCDVNEEAAKSFSRKYGIPKFYVDFEELLNEERPSIVDICTSPQTHKPLAVRAMKLGCHVLLEKPIAMSARDAEEIMLVWKRSGVMLCVVHNWPFQPVVLEVRRMVEGGRLSKIVGVQVEALHTGNDPMTSNPNHWSHRILGGRVERDHDECEILREVGIAGCNVKCLKRFGRSLGVGFLISAITSDPLSYRKSLSKHPLIERAAFTFCKLMSMLMKSYDNLVVVGA